MVGITKSGPAVLIFFNFAVNEVPDRSMANVECYHLWRYVLWLFQTNHLCKTEKKSSFTVTIIKYNFQRAFKPQGYNIKTE